MEQELKQEPAQSSKSVKWKPLLPKFTEIMSVESCPPALKPVAHYLKVAEDHDSRDIVISYWCRLYGLEVALQINKEAKTPEVNKFLLSIMDWLETTKAENADNECITNKVCAQSYIENYALKLFQYSDDLDKAERYTKNLVKGFYTSAILMDILSSFGLLDEEMAEKHKYAKWKAAYVHNCLKVGEKPQAGSFGNAPQEFTRIDPNSNDEFSENNTNEHLNNVDIPSFPDVPSETHSIPQLPLNPTIPMDPFGGMQPPPANLLTPSVPRNPAQSPSSDHSTLPSSISAGSFNTESMNPEQIQKAQKYCKWATSALNYDDVKTAIENLTKALTLLQTGSELTE